MIHLPDPPAGSAIRVEPVAEGIRLKWKPRPQRRAFLWASLGLALACVVFYYILRGAMDSRRTTTGEWIEFLGVIATGVALVGLSVAVSVRRHSRALEILVLKDDSLVHFPAWTPARAERALVMGEGPWWASGWMAKFRPFLGKRESVSLERKSIIGIESMGRGKFEHIALTMRVGHLDIAKHISRADREWLLGVLRRWRDTGKEGAA
ncbi:MAG: hypothetical protein ACYSU0_02730 [Planctomycetota bacterium]|jgi:hypothetical protein